jgi:signal transduction histidine kinase
VPRQINLKDLFPYFEMLNADYFRRQGVELRIETADLEVRADPDKLVRILQNLTNNACQAMLFGGHICLSARDDGEWVTLLVADNGPGIPVELREHLFEPFVTSGNHGGTGLGTSIAKSLIEAHGGTISFVTGDAGTTFSIRLPKRLHLELA